MMNKICTKCEEKKDLDDFANDKKGKYGKSSQCRDCKNKYDKKYNKENKEKKKKYREKNKERIKRKNKEWSEKNKEKRKEYNIKYLEKNKERLKKYWKRYREENKEKRNEKSRLWRKKNKEYVSKKRKENKEYFKDYKKKYRKKNRKHINKLARNYNKRPDRNLHMRITCRVYKNLRDKKQNKSWKEFFDFSLEDLKNHIEDRFKEGMSWNNTEEWVIDHIIPVSLFDFNNFTDYEFKMCWSLNNLQPLWKKENETKWAKLDYYTEQELKEFGVLDIYNYIKRKDNGETRDNTSEDDGNELEG